LKNGADEGPNFKKGGGQKKTDSKKGKVKGVLSPQLPTAGGRHHGKQKGWRTLEKGE